MTSAGMIVGLADELIASDTASATPLDWFRLHLAGGGTAALNAGWIAPTGIQ